MIDTLYEKFKPWSATGSIYIISDTHFDDSDCKLMNPNWISPQEHIDKINSKVHKCDTLIHLGDVGNAEWLKKLKAGYKVLITGNHDAGANKYKEYFDEIYTGPLMIADRIMLSHEPVPSKFWVNIHGHTHNNPMFICGKPDELEVNLASDCANWEVWSLNDLIKKEKILSGVQNYHRYTIDNATERNGIKKDGEH